MTSFSSTTQTISDRYSPVQASTGTDTPTSSRARKSDDSVNSSAVTSASQPRFEPSSGRSRSISHIDRALLDRACEVLDGIEGAAPENRVLAIESLRCISSELWTTAASASADHQSLLAAVEAFILGLNDITASQASALRGAFVDLRQPRLTENYVDIVASRLIDEGYSPMAPISDMIEDSNAESTEQS